MKVLHYALAASAALALMGAGQAATAQTFQPKKAGTMMLNVRLTDVAPDAGDAITTTAGAPTGLTAEVSDAVVPSIGVTYFFTDNIAAEVIATTTRHTIKAQGPGTDIEVKKTWVLPPVVSLQYHFMPEAKFSPYVGAGVSYMAFYSGSDRNGFHLHLKDGFGTALQAGADIALNGPWSANLDVKKVFFETDATDSAAGLKSKVHLDPWVVSVGAGYKF